MPGGKKKLDDDDDDLGLPAAGKGAKGSAPAPAPLRCARCGRRKAFDDVRCLDCRGRGITEPTRWIPA